MTKYRVGKLLSSVGVGWGKADHVCHFYILNLNGAVLFQCFVFCRPRKFERVGIKSRVLI